MIDAIKASLEFRYFLTLVLVVVSATMLFVPVVVGASDIRAMFLLLTGIAVRDAFAAKAEAVRQENANPTPGPISNL